MKVKKMIKVSTLEIINSDVKELRELPEINRYRRDFLVERIAGNCEMLKKGIEEQEWSENVYKAYMANKDLTRRMFKRYIDFSFDNKHSNIEPHGIDGLIINYNNYTFEKQDQEHGNEMEGDND